MKAFESNLAVMLVWKSYIILISCAHLIFFICHANHDSNGKLLYDRNTQAAKVNALYMTFSQVSELWPLGILYFV